MTPAPTRAGTSPLAETISVLQAARAPRSDFSSTIDLHIAILQAREQIAAELPCTGSDTPVSDDGSRPAPALSLQGFVTDWNAFVRLFREICLIAAHHHPEQAEPFEEFAQSDLPRLQEWADAYLHNELDIRWTPQPLLLGFVLNNTLHPFLAASPAWATWKARVDKDAYQGNCPVCGGEPDFAALEKESGARRLLCSRCDTEWAFHRAMCPFCETADPAHWGYYADGEGAYRLYVCNRCRRYLKTIDLRELVRPVNLAAERILTIPMDIAALNAGYLATFLADLSPAN